MEKKAGLNFKRILINGFVLFTVLIGLSYASVVITNTDIQKNGVSAMFQGSTWTTSQNASLYTLSLHILNKTNDAGVVVGCTYGNTTAPVWTANVSLCAE